MCENAQHRHIGEGSGEQSEMRTQRSIYNPKSCSSISAGVLIAASVGL